MALLQNINTQTVPFSLLGSSELDYLQSHLDIGYYQTGEAIISGGSESCGMYLIIKGCVTELERSDENSDQAHALVHYGAQEYFGAWSAMRGCSLHHFIAEEETICYILPVGNLRHLICQNTAFGDYFNNPSVQQELLETLALDLRMTEFIHATVGKSCMRPALVLDNTDDLRQATIHMREQCMDSALVKRGNRYGMVTRTNLLDALVLQELPLVTLAQDIANYRLITVEENDYLFNALVIMTKHEIDRVVVMHQGQLMGIVELAEALSFISSQSHFVGIGIERASNVAELRAIAGDMESLIRSLFTQGVKVRFLMGLLAALNKRLMAKLFYLIVPEDIIPHVCLVVMGSEGRGEQITKTDQDNGLIMRDGLDWPQGPEVLKAFSDALEDIGFPTCLGKVMVSNPFWVQSISEWTQRMQDWVIQRDEQSLLNLAIAVDASPVAGNSALYKTSRNWFFKEVHKHRQFLPTFAKAAMVFDTPLTLLGSIRGRSNGVDLKRGGIFPIVQGVRSLALQNQIATNNTFSRIDALIEADVLPMQLGKELQEAFALFHWLRLKCAIANDLDALRDHKDFNRIDLGDLNRMEKNSLRQSFQVVKEFKLHLRLRFQLGGTL